MLFILARKQFVHDQYLAAELLRKCSSSQSQFISLKQGGGGDGIMVYFEAIKFGVYEIGGDRNAEV
jgi:hypothetical protein